MDTLRELFDPEIVWHFPGRSPLAGDHRGTDVVLGFFGRTMELTAGTLRAELSVHDVVADDRHTVGMHLGTGERGAEGLRIEVLVFHVRDGRVVEVWQYIEDQYTYDEFFSQALQLRRGHFWYTVGTRPLGSLGSATGISGHQRSGGTPGQRRCQATARQPFTRRARVRVSRPAAASLWLLATVQSSSRTGLTLR
jgi:uncharacterized protein